MGWDTLSWSGYLLFVCPSCVSIFWECWLRVSTHIKVLYVELQKMSIYAKYQRALCKNEYSEYLLDCIKEHLGGQIEIDDTFNCPGDGECFTNIPGTYVFYRDKRCTQNCILKKCPNHVLCKSLVPQTVLDDYFGLCYSCSLSYKPCDIGKGVLKTFDDAACAGCRTRGTCIEQAFCEHNLCISCFELTHYKPGNGECPVCGISARKVIK